MKYSLHCMADYKNKNLNQNRTTNKKSNGNFPANNSKQSISKRWGRYEQIKIMV